MLKITLQFATIRLYLILCIVAILYVYMVLCIALMIFMSIEVCVWLNQEIKLDFVWTNNMVDYSGWVKDILIGLYLIPQCNWLKGHD